MFYRAIFCLSFFLLLLGRAASAQELSLSGSVPRTSATVSARAVLARQPLWPGQEAQVVVEITVKPGYHIQSAFAPKPYIPAQLTVPNVPDIAVGTIQFQKATEIPSPPALGKGTLSVYNGKAYILVPLTIAANAAAGDRQLELDLRTQACNDTTCDPPKTITLQVAVPVGKPGDAQTQGDAAVLAAIRDVQFAPGPMPIPPSTNAVAAVSAAEQVTEIERRAYRAYNTGDEQHSLLQILIFALLGGLILNIMPCVLPVIPLKALSFIQQAHGNHRLALLHGLAFSAGIISLFAMLAVVLRTLGLFYGQQFQSPAFLIVMTMFVIALSLSMLGVWTINPPQSVYQADSALSGKQTFLSSYGSGLMATLLATPCSAPFLGPVFAWALVQPTAVTAGALSVVGLGMSLPYLVLALFPQWLNKVPRAGRWSELLKQGLGIVMLGVAIYLITRIPNTRMWFWILMGGLLVGLVCWAWGQIPTLTMSAGRFWGIRVAVVALGAVAGTGLYVFADRATRPSRVQWQPFSLALLDEGLRQGRPVVVDWTADWCINCQALDAAVLSREATQNAFVESNALLLKADLTVDNPAATALNRKLGGEAIPVLAIFSPARKTEPVVLRDSYSVSRVVEELKRAK